MSVLRKELVDVTAADATKLLNVESVTAYLLILRAVEGQPGLIHGHLRDHGRFCAIGSFFDLHVGKLTLPTPLVDEVAAVNDAVPHLSKRARKRHMLEWLRWKLGTLGWAADATPAKKRADEVMATLARQVEDVARASHQDAHGRQR